MPSNNHHRRSIRLQGFDYSQPGGYFVTITVYQRENLFGSQPAETVNLNPIGQLIAEYWQKIALLSYVDLGEWVIMPNHVHGILYLLNDAEVSQRPAHGTQPRSISAIVQSFKSVTTMMINRIRGKPGFPVWQRNYYEHIIRGDGELEKIRKYIVDNPIRHFLKESDDLFG